MSETTSSDQANDPLRSARMRADDYCKGQMQDWQTHGDAAATAIKEISARFGTSPKQAEIATMLAELRERAEACRGMFVLFAVRHAVLTGRLPEDRQADTLNRCADEDGLVAFLDEMRLVPIGFVDPPASALARN